jgi:peptide/nickel transport system substrate-binding protein
MRVRTWRALLALLAVFAFLAASCGGDDDDGGSGTGNEAGDDTGSDDGGEQASGGTLVFGASADPVVLDPAYVSDGESFRVIDQIFETLVTTEPGGTELAPALASEWEGAEDGMSWTFTLEEGVTFHDGEPFNAEAVCVNFERWYNFTGVQQSAAVSYYWQTVFGGYAQNEDDALGESLYESCEAVDETHVTINLTRPSASFLPGLAVSAFGIASPKALEEGGADDVGGTAEEPDLNTAFGTENPVGTGPFMFDSWTRGESLRIVRFDDYWGEKAILDEVIFRPIADGPARRQALESGEIQGYDLVDPADLGDLEAGGFQIMPRPAFNVGYLGFNQSHAPLDNQQIRQAIAHAIDRESLVSSLYPEGAEVAQEFMPPDLFGWTEDVTQYDYDPDMARQLIEDSGVTDLNLDFWYPTGVSRPYMPDPQANFQAMAEDLEAVGFTVTPHAAQWDTDYLDGVDSGQAPMYLLGWTGDYGDPDNFVGTFFQQQSPQFGFDNQEIFDALNEAEAETDEEARTAAYEEANRLIMDFLPGLPYVHTSPALAFAPNVQGYVPSPVSLESFATVSIED